MDEINNMPETEISVQPVYDAGESTGPAIRKFTVRPREGIAAVLMLVTAYLYSCLLADVQPPMILLGITAVLLTVITELIHSETKRSAESCIWFACFAMCTVGTAFKRFAVWEDGQSFLFLHVFFVWWVFSRGNKQIEGESGHLLPFDAFNAFLSIPFSHFFLKERVLADGIKNGIGHGKGERKRNYWIIPASVICLVLFCSSASLLSRADSSFGSFFSNIFDYIDENLDFDFVFKLILSIPVGCWLFGLISGTARTEGSQLTLQRGRIYLFLDGLKKLPGKFWTVVIGLFSAMYLAFFMLQGSYLFGAFTHTLPDGFIVSQYAREGFFELCKVTALNFAVLWLATRSVSAEDSAGKVYRSFCLAMLIENAVFAVIAFSKLALYISCFGFTPLRLQSTWLVCLLFAGCVLWTVEMLTDKKVFRIWMYIGAVSLSVLSLF